MKRNILVLLICCLAFFLQSAVFAANAPPTFIQVDQFGYLTNAKKVAVISDPITGFNSRLSFAPSLGKDQYQVRRVADNAVVFSGTISPWNGGAVDASSGDRGWWFDFSALTTPGQYYIIDVSKNVRSYPFRIGNDVYNNVLKAATRMFYYNRSNTSKLALHAGSNWADGASFVGPFQDKAARSFTARTNNATARDLSGGWWDAGDYNKYTTFAVTPIHYLLDAYSQSPGIWGDNYNIPESGNGIPDILDEVKWELEFLKKMQNADGSAIAKMGLLSNDFVGSLPPSTDKRFRYYYPGSCSSATIAVATMFSHAANVYAKIPRYKAFAQDLKTRAIKAYNWFSTHPINLNCDNQNLPVYIAAGDADQDTDWQKNTKTEAAVYLFAATGDPAYRNAVDIGYKAIAQRAWDVPYTVPFEPNFQAALLYYATLSKATPAVARDIKARKIASTKETEKFIYGFNQGANRDLYRAYMDKDAYTWGSNSTRAALANLNADMLFYKLDPAKASDYLARTREILHYFHGVNPIGLVYLSNMNSYGASNSVPELYHSWFSDRSPWDNISSANGGPAPGYVVGGPNPTYTFDDGTCPLVPPCKQPPQKSYLSWNTDFPENSYKVTEPAIYYQANYVKMLANVIKSAAVP